MAALKLYSIPAGSGRTVVRLSDVELPLYPDAVPVGHDGQPLASRKAGEADGKRRTAPANKARTGETGPASK